MLTWENWMDIKQLYREGHSIKHITQLTGYARNTVRKVLRNDKPSVPNRRQRTTKLDSYKDYVRERYLSSGLSVVRLFREIQSMGYSGSIHSLYRFLRPLRQQEASSSRLTVRFETPPGKQAQCDWGDCGYYTDADGQQRKLYVFVMVLSYSRFMYVEFTTSMKLPVLLQCHINAFDYFNGTPETILYDNMKQVRLDPQRLHPQFIDFASHYAITVKTHRPYRARTKGKVERMVYYVKDNFLNGNTFYGLEDINSKARHWLEHQANTRLHATTNQRPCDTIGDEDLRDISKHPQYAMVNRYRRKVSVEATVRYQRSSYTVPPVYVGKTVTIEPRGKHIHILYHDQLITSHNQAQRPGMYITNDQHVSDLWRLSIPSQQKPLSRWHMHHDQYVEQRPLALYEEII